MSKRRRVNFWINNLIIKSFGHKTWATKDLHLALLLRSVSELKIEFMWPKALAAGAPEKPCEQTLLRSMANTPTSIGYITIQEGSNEQLLKQSTALECGELHADYFAGNDR